MTNTIALQNSKNPYGAFELKQLYPKNYSLGLTIAAFFHFSIIAVYFLVIFFQAEDIDLIPWAKTRIVSIGTPPSIIDQIPTTPIPSTNTKPGKGIPVPVPDGSVSVDQTLANQGEMNEPSPLIGEGNEKYVPYTPGDGKILDPNDNPDPGVFIPTQTYPSIVVRANPVYPVLAVRSGLEGRVVAKILVSREGIPQKVMIVKSDAEVFNQSTIEAAMNYRFTPAIQNNKPIAVWVTIPFKFELKGR